MPSQRPKFYNEGFFHLNLRAVGNEIIFRDEDDYYRGIYSLYEFNNSNPVTIQERRRRREVFKKSQKKSYRCPTPIEFVDDRQRFVDILTFCFMPNHIHLITKQLQENGISNFIKKVSGGYANYYNLKYKRKGHFFNRFKPVHIETDEQLRNVLLYTWANPASLVEPGWKETGIKNPGKVIKFLENDYRWSSFFDYIGTKNFPSVTNKEFILKFLGGEDKCREALKDWIMYKKKL